MEKTKEISGVYQHEDGVLKNAMQFFADELLPYFEIEGKVIGFAPTELVQLELHKLFQDFNLVMEDGSWKHFEFQSTNEGLDGLKRFRVYEATSSYQNKVEVVTYVLYSGKIKNPMVEFTEGVNTYRICPIIMKNQDADELIAKLNEKIESGEEVTKSDLVPLVLCPLMGGEMSQKDRIKATFQITRQVTTVSEEETRKIESMVYAMAEKFLDNVELDELKEGMKMTRLGKMLVNDGIEQGIERGIENTIKICKEFGVSIEETVDKISNMFERDIEDTKNLVNKYWSE